jgi:hypothetical protein
MGSEAVVVKAVPQHLPEELRETKICHGTADRKSTHEDLQLRSKSIKHCSVIFHQNLS